MELWNGPHELVAGYLGNELTMTNCVGNKSQTFRLEATRVQRQ